jgi:protein-tyrosine phosphatase
MFGIFKKSKPAGTGLGMIATDMHSHLLPGIDDGSPDVATSLQLIKGLQQLGYTKFITTPHIYKELYPNTRQTITDAHARLQEGLATAGMAVDIHYAAEYFLDDHFDELLASGEPLLTLKENWVLIEFSFASPPMDLDKKIFALQMAGYQPVLAHPERYGYFAANKKMFEKLHDHGCIFQLNLLSYTGYYGKQPQELAHYLLKQDYYRLLGTDLHHDRHLSGLQAPALSTLAQKLLDADKLLNISL